MTIVGHEGVVTALASALPPATLLLGPPSVGKWTLAHHLAAHHNVAIVDRASYPDPLTVEQARQITAFVSTAPFGAFKLVIARLDDASDAALNALLKTLEEPPPTARFLLVSSAPVMPTVASRCVVCRLGLLTVDQLAEILRRHGLTEHQARTSAVFGGGQVKAALASHRSVGSRNAVLGVVRAIATNDPVLFDHSFKGWDEASHEELAHWLREAITNQRLMFIDQEFYGLHTKPELIREMVAALSRAPDARTRIGVRAALQPYLYRT